MLFRRHQQTFVYVKDTVFSKSQSDSLLIIGYLFQVVSRLAVSISKVVQGERVSRFLFQKPLMK
ncbi:MAG: hypothetical protein JRJ50_11860 [Deltaproteobacteria bacterium]|nr:hypothetical protein [Deltaproteobacteria bacterium]